MCWLDVVQNFVEARAVRHVAVVQLQRGGVKQVLNARRVYRGRTPNQAVHQIAFAKEQLGQVRAVLTGDSSDKSNASHVVDVLGRAI